MWIVFSFLYATFDSLQNVYYKKSSVQINPVLIAWSVLIISAICYLPLLFLGIPNLSSGFWIAVVARVFVDSFAFTLFIKGVQKSPLSLTIPMLSLSPILSIGTVFVLSGLLPSQLGLIGVLVTVGGLYYLNFDHDTKHLLSPFKSIIKERGVMYVSIASMLWSIVSALQKYGIDNSSTTFYTSFFQLFWAICFTPVAYFADKKNFTLIFKPRLLKALIPAGLLDAIKNFFQNAAYSLTIPAYVNSIGNTGILVSAVFGYLFFKEKIKNHILPIFIIFVGLTLIVMGQSQ